MIALVLIGERCGNGTTMRFAGAGWEPEQGMLEEDSVAPPGRSPRGDQTRCV